MSETEQQPTTTTPAAPSFTITDLRQCKIIIETAVSRGAFKPNELSVVGSTYDRLDAFVKHQLDALSTEKEPQQGEEE